MSIPCAGFVMPLSYGQLVAVVMGADVTLAVTGGACKPFVCCCSALLEFYVPGMLFTAMC
jgi:hypothetical protein